MLLIIKAKEASSGKYSNETCTRKEKLFLGCVRNIVKEVDLYVPMT